MRKSPIMECLKQVQVERLRNAIDNFKFSEPTGSKFICNRCEDTGSYEMTGDLHKSSGIVPCYDCSWQKSKET